MNHEGNNNNVSLIHRSFLAVPLPPREGFFQSYAGPTKLRCSKTEDRKINIHYSIFSIHSRKRSAACAGHERGGVRVIPPKNGRGTYQSEPSPLVSSPSEIRIGRCYPIVLLTAASAARRTALVISSSSMKGVFSLPGTPSTCSRMNGTCMKPAGTLSQSP